MPTEITVDEGLGTAAPAVGMALGGPLGAMAGSAVSGLFNAASARRQEKFQERMANTAYQRAAKDLEAAGLNRVLALGSPGSTPGGASATMQAPDFAQATKSRQETSNARDIIDAQVDATRAQATASRNAANRDYTQSKVNEEQERLVKANADEAEFKKGIYEAIKPGSDAFFNWVTSMFNGGMSNSQDARGK